MAMPSTNGIETLPFSFYARETLLVARDLLGKILVHRVRGKEAGGRIVETEGYLGRQDPASHAFRGPTPRASIMFDRPGKAYVYFIYGNHYCFNVVAHDGTAGAVLVRAMEPVAGIPDMMRRRGVRELGLLTNGPGKLTQALAISAGQNGADLTRGSLVILDAPEPEEPVVSSPRVGIREARSLRYRFSLRNNRFVSAPRPW